MPQASADTIHLHSLACVYVACDGSLIHVAILPEVMQRRPAWAVSVQKASWRRSRVCAQHSHPDAASGREQEAVVTQRLQVATGKRQPHVAPESDIGIHPLRNR